ncbi:hypothetical protein CORT_0E02130 [Candida orthopsilosis Co 90-125]|uniref:Uncharacterized protein n=1 Tax=Candida orthopsilosis (strain 90-125) TaxID=1136231 RepID=H8X7L5_CANO9|nr:hypothetical protein CORT_0E02130 [Candida orthopsilosis Co 90-125]CCG23800.1 hypothetical protein CORT_0E02130 [Candida orthopsilosis Co 90-125]
MFKRAFYKGASTITKTNTPSVKVAGPELTNKAGQQGSFRSFAEYRLRMTNQSPLAVRAKNFNSTLRTTHH